ncbi:MAG: M15 family metallopeptidase [Bacteroidota bacterium]
MNIIQFLMAGTTIGMICTAMIGDCKSDEEERRIPEGFGYVHEAVPDVKYDIRYCTHDNFVGAPVDGYLAPVAILTRDALEALKKAANELRDKGYGMIVFDGYRPQKAVDHFVRWARDESDTLTKQKYYPEVDKADLFTEGYIAERSGHSRGSTIDLSLYDLETGEEIDMGSGFDLFGPPSHHGTDLVTAGQSANRHILKDVMERHGFAPYSREWWHYRLIDEPHTETFFDFDVQ